MHPKRDLAIILRTVPFEERHRVATALTFENGMISAMAKNSIQSRRFGGTLELFAASEWFFTTRPGSELHHLSEAHIREPFEKLRQDFNRLSLASLLSELVLRVAPQNEPCPDLFRLHSNALTALNEVSMFKQLNSFGQDVALLDIAFLNVYLAKLLQWTGNQPRFHQCFHCLSPLEQLSPEAELTGIVSSAGWVCHSCRVKSTKHIHDSAGQGIQYALLRFTPQVMTDLLSSLNLPIRQVFDQIKAPRSEHCKLFRFLEALFVFHIPGFDLRPLKSLRFLELESSARHLEAN